MTLKRHERQAMRRIGIILASLMIAATGLVLSAGTASAASCFASHQPGGNMPWKFGSEIRATGLVVCSAKVTMNATVTLTKNGTVVASHTDHVTADSWAPFTSFSPDPAGAQTYCERSSATWSGGSTTGSWQCELL